ncbi:uncharacterized protein Tco_0625767 [Tanacetum coccineum]|uniref:DUF4218 domain-containing protein n=1 Tax=Tanacetum coccineum TaxID=301880 RepID=A0ABQ4WHS9_9ASTR
MHKKFIERKMKEKMKGKGKMNVKVKQKATNSNEKEGNEHERQDNWKKKSIFFELVYWDFLPIRHNLDVMHIEKNVCDNVLFTLLGIARKMKDHLNARLDLKELNIRPSLHPQETNSSRILLPPACFTLGKDEKYRFLKDLKVPDGYASNISRCVHLKELSMWGLKSHDNHIILQQLLPLAVRRLLPKHVVEALIELSNFFRILCSKVNSKYDLQKLQDRISLTLCHLEKIFPPSFFDIMEHLPIHLAEEALLAGPVQYRWMYPIERYLLTLKMYVRNRARPEGCIAKGALMEECMTFCARKHSRSIQKLTPRERQRIHNKEFPSWFRADVRVEYQKIKVLTTEVIDMAMGLTNMAKRYNGYVVNGFRFRTKGMDNSRVTQNSGVVVITSTTCFSSRKDKNPMSGELTYYEKLTDIIEVRYTDETKFFLFKCNWVDNRTGVKVDNFEDNQDTPLEDSSQELTRNNTTDASVQSSLASNGSGSSKTNDILLGGIAKCGAHAPLNIVSWKSMPNTYLELMWRDVQHKTDAPEHYKDTCLKFIGGHWKKWKSRVKHDFFTPNKDDPEKLLTPPSDSRVNPEQWPNLVNYWQRDDVQAQSLKNSNNRKNLEFLPRTGRTSHANVREEMKTNNEDLCPANVFIKTRTANNSSIPDEDTRIVVDRMKEKLNEVPESEQTNSFKEQVFIDLVGPDGHRSVKTFGGGVSSRNWFEVISIFTARKGVVNYVGFYAFGIWFGLSMKIDERVQTFLLSHLFNVTITDSESEPFEDFRETEIPQPLPIASSPVLTSDDPYLIVGQAHTPTAIDIESEPEEAPSETEELQPLAARILPLTDDEFEASDLSNTRITSSHSITPSDSTTSLSPDHPLTQTAPTPKLSRPLYYRRTTRMVMHIQPTLSPGFSARLTETMALSPSSFHKRYRSSYETPSSSASPIPSLTLPIRKSLENEESEDEKALGLGYGEARSRALEIAGEIAPSTFEIGQSSRFTLDQMVADKTPTPRIPAHTTWIDHKDDTIYLDIEFDPPSRVPVQTPASPEWSSGSLPVSLASLTIPLPIASPATTPAATIAIDEDKFLELGAQLELHKSILHDYTQHLDALQPTLLEGHGRDITEHATITFGALWRPMLALEAWAGHTDAQRAAMWQARYEDHRRGAVESSRLHEGGYLVRILSSFEVSSRSTVSYLVQLLSSFEVKNQGNNKNQNGDAVNDNIQGDVRNVIVNNDRRGCTYKEFLACNPKEYDGKGGAIVYTRWIEKMESVQDMSGWTQDQYAISGKDQYAVIQSHREIKYLEDIKRGSYSKKLLNTPSIRRKSCAETMEQYMSKTRADYGSGVARPKIEDKDNFELKGQFLKELRTNTFSSSDHEDTNEHIEKVLEIERGFGSLRALLDTSPERLCPFGLVLLKAVQARYEYWDHTNRRASVSVMPLSTYLNLGLGELAHTKLTVELADRTVKYPIGIVENVLVDFAVLEDMDAYHDEGIGNVIFDEPFLRDVGINAKRFEGMITIYNGNEDVTYQMVRSLRVLSIRRIHAHDTAYSTDWPVFRYFLQVSQYGVFEFIDTDLAEKKSTTVGEVSTI